MRNAFAALCVVLFVSMTMATKAEDKPGPQLPGQTGAMRRAKADKDMKNGNWKDAYEGFKALVLDPADEKLLAGGDLKNALTCLTNLNRQDEVDDLFEKVVALHKDNWHLLYEAAQSMQNNVQHWGFIVAGKFTRGNHRGGGGAYCQPFLRDRVRALQLMNQAADLPKGEDEKKQVGQFYLEFARFLMHDFNGQQQAWRFQNLTDLKELPDYNEPWWYGGGANGAPVNADGTPVYYQTPKSFAAAASDGERWRWCLQQAAEYNADLAPSARFEFASFLRSQFDVQTAAEYSRYFGAGDDEAKPNEANPYSLLSLGEDETIARLAIGVKRFKMVDEFNFIKILQQNAKDPAPGNVEPALNLLAQIFEDRQQYDKAADYWQRSITVSPQPYKRQRLDQIVGNWGTLEPSQTQVPGKGADLEFRFRNGNKVSFEATEVDVKKLLDDVKTYIKSKPKQLDWNRTNIYDIGNKLVQQQQTQYLGAKAAEWDAELKPRDHHFDRRITVTAPLKKAGAYLISSRMAGGNTTRVLLWIQDTVIVEKHVDKKGYYFLADATTGAPIANATLDFFGYEQHWNWDPAGKNNTMDINVSEMSSTSDAEGQVILKTVPAQNYQWLLTASTADGRFAFLGFTNIWAGQYYDYEYNQTKVFTITDRPVYRPNQTVKFKFWANTAKYDLEGKSQFAGHNYVIEVHNPKGEKIFSKGVTADDFGGMDSEITLAKEADLGVYGLWLCNPPDSEHAGVVGQSSFRVEEYKKPEFEVKVDAPSEPVMLGEKVAAKINAKYLFGAPVVDAKVSYKVLRYSHTANWYPLGRWDWLYQPGYWWFACDYDWYPGFRDWGCRRPIPIWWGGRQWEQPEVVMQNETPIGADGTLNIDIDTALAKAVHGNTDHRYEITAEVTDSSRRMIVGTGSVMVARKPFKVYAWVDRGHYHTGDTIEADFSAQTLDNKPVKGQGKLKLMKVSYDENGKPVEKEAQNWDLDTGDQGKSHVQIKASEAGQYRLSYTVKDSKDHSIEGGYVFCITGEGFDSSKFHFNDIELVTDKREYKAGENAQIMVNTDRASSTVLLFIRAANSSYLEPKILHLTGKSVLEPIEIQKRDMPNFFVEAVTVSNGRIHSEVREVIVPPESRMLNVEVVPSSTTYKPGEKASVQLKLSEINGEPYAGSAVVTVYDKAVEYISGGSNVPEIKKFYWDWRRSHYPQNHTSLEHYSQLLLRNNELAMNYIGAFGYMNSMENDEADALNERDQGRNKGGEGRKALKDGVGGRGLRRAVEKQQMAAQNAAPAAPMAAAKSAGMDAMREERAASDKPMEQTEAGDDRISGGGGAGEPESMAQATVRQNFADTAYWAATINTGVDGIAKFELTMPENLTTWKFKVWAMGRGTRVGQGEVEAVTTKNLLVRLQAPRFFTQKDEVVLSANVHNYLKTKKTVQVALELEGGTLEPIDGGRGLQDSVEIEPAGEKRVDWRVKVLASGQAIVRVKALTNEESDAMQMSFPAYIHGMEKMDSFSGNIRPDKNSATLAFAVPAERRPEDSRLEIRYSPTLAGAMVDAIPYLTDYPYGCTEQTLSRFLPTVITQRVLNRMNLNLKEIRDKITNLNAQEIGDDVARAKQWQRRGANPVFDEDEVKERVKAGVTRLTTMQLTDGGWGWFSGWGEHSSPHTTAYVVHGLQIAKNNDVKIENGVLERGQQWLKNYQSEQLTWLKNYENKIEHAPQKAKADNLDAFVYMVLNDAKSTNNEMLDRLYRDRNDLAVYSKAMLGLVFNKNQDKERLAMIMQNIDQYLVQDDENQTAYLKLPEDNYWWNWYGSEYEAHAYYLKLLAATDAKSEKASRLVKYLLNNRKHATYWNSTRDTAVCIEALAEYLTASGEDSPDMKLSVMLDGQKAKEVTISASNLFTFDNKLVLTGDKITSGKHNVEFVREGKGPLYFNAYVTNFTLEDHIGSAGLEVKVNRKYYKLKPVDKKVQVEGSRGQSVDQKVEKYEREELKDNATLKSGDLVEIELEIDSKNDYEYLLFEDPKPAGFEPVDVQSGYTNTGLWAYRELRDERVCFFVRSLARGKNSVSYRMRAEIPGKFNALPTKASAMYAPELRGNSEEIKLQVQD
jgi:uncharacterized protein YfaS (alpha-2-macroglobulin family)